MADVRPFRGLRYNPDAVGELSNIISPPFDTISPELQSSLHRRSPYNVVRLESGERQPSDTPADNRYTRAAALMADWRDNRVLVRDGEPSFYLVEHTFTHEGRRARLELLASVRVEEYERGVVLPHEFTRDADKRDRLALIQACHANFSPIMCLYRDEGGGLDRVLRRAMAGPPLADFSDAGQQGYRVWKIEGESTGEISEALSSRSLYIADGHHRYETALNYRNLTASEGAPSADAAHNFVMMGLISFDDPGLLVLPYHRVLGGLDDGALAKVRKGLGELFDLQAYGGGLEGFLAEIEAMGKGRLVMGLMDPHGRQGLQLLTLKAWTDTTACGVLGGSEAWILEEQVLRLILGESLGGHVEYVHQGDEAESLVARGEYQMAFFLKPFPLDLFETVMNMGQRLPPKSTFFYPKLATGLVINPLEGRL